MAAVCQYSIGSRQLSLSPVGVTEMTTYGLYIFTTAMRCMQGPDTLGYAKWQALAIGEYAGRVCLSVTQS